MWLFTKFGFFSIVRKPEDIKAHTLTIRARAKEDLVALRDTHLPNLGPIQEHAGSDYRYRARVLQSDFAIALLQIGLGIDYPNFKDAVAAQQGPARSDLYHQVWNVMAEMQSGDPAPAPRPVVAGRRKTGGMVGAMAGGTARVAVGGMAGAAVGGIISYGGVLFDEQGRVLLRKPAGEFDNYVWTFPKGRAEPGKSAEETALREVLEETGYQAKILGKLSSSFQGGTGTTEYFIMHPVGKPAAFDPKETQVVEWVTFGDAVSYLMQTRNPAGRDRDLRVLKAAIIEYKKLQGAV